MRWTESETFQFVKLYLGYDNLWNTGHEDYKIKDKRIKAYHNITSEFMSITGILLNEHELKTKIKNLRSTYIQELTKIKQRSIGDYEYKPTIKWFEYWDSCFRKRQEKRCSDAVFETSLLNENTVIKIIHIPIKDILTFKESELEQEHNQNLWLPEDSEILCGAPDPFEAQNNNDLGLILKSEPGVQSTIKRTLKYKMKRKKLKHRSPSTDVSDQSQFKGSFENLDTCKDDEFDIYGKYIASQLRTMDLKRALRLQFEIQSLVSGARLSDLSS